VALISNDTHALKKWQASDRLYTDCRDVKHFS
jgi:hypothetical protein